MFDRPLHYCTSVVTDRHCNPSPYHQKAYADLDIEVALVVGKYHRTDPLDLAVRRSQLKVVHQKHRVNINSLSYGQNGFCPPMLIDHQL